MSSPNLIQTVNLFLKKKTLAIFSPVGCPQIYLSCSNFQRIALTNWCFYQIGCFPRQANLEKSIGRRKSYNSYIRELRNWGGTKEATILMWKSFCLSYLHYLSFLATFHNICSRFVNLLLFMVRLLCFDLKEIILQRHKWRHRDASRGDWSYGRALCLASGKQSLI